ncbi:MAG: GNAT family N-acetyltransferase [Bacteroidales bacterium]|nr:GNAT family N-acetyltransferase [Bacteroidales bacterium]
MEFKTERIYIRPVCMDDKESMFRYRSDSDTNKYLSLIPQSVEDVAAFINATSSEMNVPGTWYQFVIIEQTSNLLIGDIGLHFLKSDAENKQVEIGYTLSKDFRGKGYATEALKIIIDFLVYTLNKHRIIASIDPVNIDSIKLVERLGFRKEAHFVESIFFHGKWVDDLVYAILAKEWKQRMQIG